MFLQFQRKEEYFILENLAFLANTLTIDFMHCYLKRLMTPSCS